MQTNAVAPTPGFWRRAWNVMRTVEMSSGEIQDLRVDALERRVARLEKTLQSRASAASETPGSPLQETS